tara:strand:+ start:321 stop:1352 length:1032 start_codon:yes stop_codon:yes gene_type:complete
MSSLRKTILVTGAAGFIGADVSKKLLMRGAKVIGIDNLNDYYDVNLKNDRLNYIKNLQGDWDFHKLSLEDNMKLKSVFENYNPDIVINLAAQAGVRYSIENPDSYIKSNLLGFANILENCRQYNIKNLIYASSSSVYGGNIRYPFKEEHAVNHPVSLYAATKKANELMAHSYSYLYKIPATGLRFFTVYGPWGRPDMAPMIFAKSILNRKTISIFNNGDMFRDFTYIDDITNGIILCCNKPANANQKFDRYNPDPSTSFAPHRIFNIGNNQPIKLMQFIKILEETLGIKAIKEFKSMQNGDVQGTYADTSKLQEWVGFKAETSINQGITQFVRWYKKYYFFEK